MDTDIPNQTLNVKGVFKFEQWEGVGVARVFYYYCLFVGIVFSIKSLVVATTVSAAKFFLVLLVYTPIYLVGIALVARMISEGFISLAIIREKGLGNHNYGAKPSEHILPVNGAPSFQKTEPAPQQPAPVVDGVTSYQNSTSYHQLPPQ